MTGTLSGFPGVETAVLTAISIRIVVAIGSLSLDIEILSQPFFAVGHALRGDAAWGRIAQQCGRFGTAQVFRVADGGGLKLGGAKTAQSRSLRAVGHWRLLSRAAIAKAKLRCDPVCSTLIAMGDRPEPVLRAMEEVSLIGTMATYDSLAEASQAISQQWRAFRLAHPALASSSKFYGAARCTSDGKIHYLTGVVYEGLDDVVGGERLILEAGVYAVVHVNDTAVLHGSWLLGRWLATSGRREKHARDFERFNCISEAGTPIGPVEVWIPFDPLSQD